MRRALVTGIFGQDGSYLSELLTREGYEVHGVARADPSPHGRCLEQHLASKGVRPRMHACDLSDPQSVVSLLSAVRPRACYHLAAEHYSSETLPSEQARRDRALFAQNTISTLNLLSAIREVSADTRFVLAGSCLMYDASGTSPQSEDTPYASRSLYGLSKIAGAGLCELFRTQHGLHASTAILYNHESPRRRATFVTRKIVQGLVAVTRGAQSYLELGNLDGVKDWGFAPDYVRGMWLMAQADEPDDYVLATGRLRTVGDFAREVAGVLGHSDLGDLVRVNPSLTRPADTVALVGDPSRAMDRLGWRHSLDFRGMIELMVECELSDSLD